MWSGGRNWGTGQTSCLCVHQRGEGKMGSRTLKKKGFSGGGTQGSFLPVLVEVEGARVSLVGTCGEARARLAWEQDGRSKAAVDGQKPKDADGARVRNRMAPTDDGPCGPSHGDHARGRQRGGCGPRLVSGLFGIPDGLVMMARPSPLFLLGGPRRGLESM